MNYTKLFYWLTVADNAKTFFGWFVLIFTLIALISSVAYFICIDGSKDDSRMARKWMWWSYPFMILFWSLYIFTPDKKDALLIVAGGSTMNFLTQDSSAKQLPHELSTYLVTEIKNMASDAKLDLNIKDQKDKILEEAKSMSSTELMEKIKSDSNFAKIILDK